MIVCGFSFHSRIFHSYGDVTIVSEGLQILTYARHLWQLSCEGSLACHTYCDTGHLFILVIFEDLLLSIWQWSCHYLFLWLRSFAAGIQTPYLLLAGWTIRILQRNYNNLNLILTHHLIGWKFLIILYILCFLSQAIKNISIRTTLHLNFVHFKVTVNTSCGLYIFI